MVRSISGRLEEMTGRDFDTDPSTPGALRGATADTDPTGGAAEARKPNTDPGLGPKAPPLPPMPPAPPRPAGKQDSVEMLLDGMNAPQPERQKTTPQSAGEAAASYHAEHPVHPARTSPDEEPKVIVERPPLVPTVKVQREQVQAIIEAADEMRRAAEAEAAAKTPVPVTMGPKVLIAAVAGLVVVLVIFLLARGKGEEATSTPGAASATATATATATAMATTTTTAIATATAMATGTPIPSADTVGEAPEAPVPTVHVPVTALPTARPPRPKPAPASTGTGNVGEFKTTFH